MTVLTRMEASREDEFETGKSANLRRLRRYTIYDDDEVIMIRLFKIYVM